MVFNCGSGFPSMRPMNTAVLPLPAANRLSPLVLACLAATWLVIGVHIGAM